MTASDPSSSTSPHAPAQRGLNLVVLARPYFGLIVLATLLLVVYGVISMLRMPSGIYPEVAFPRITVIAESPGLAVTTIEISLTRPIEEAVGTVLGVRQVRSKSIRGASQVDIEFTPGTEMVQALNDVRAKIADINAQFPAGTSTLIERQSPSIFPIISFVVTGGRDPAGLYDYAYYDLRPRIKRIDDVSDVTVQGGDIREIVVEVDPQRLMSAGLSIADVADRVGKDHRLRAVGRLDQGPLQFQVLLNSQAKQPADLDQLVLAQRQRPDDPRGRRGPRHYFPRRPHLVDPLEQQGRCGRDRLPPPAGRRPLDFPTAQRIAAGIAKDGPAGRQDHAGLRPGKPGADLDRQRPRRDARRRRLQRADPAVVPPQRPGHAAHGRFHPPEPDHHLRLPAPHGRHAQSHVAGRPGRGHRADHRRFGSGRGEHRPASGRRAERRRGDRSGQPRDQRGGDRLDPDDDPRLPAAGLCPRRGGPVLPIAEPGADGGPAWFRWS